MYAPMWLSGVLILICHYQMVFASKTIMTNEISMPSLGHKEKTATFHQLQAKEIVPTRYRSARFERLRAASEDIKPVFVKPAVIETEQPLFDSSKPTPIEVIPSSETVTEIPMETLATSNETPTMTSPTFVEIPMETKMFNETPVETSSVSHETPRMETTKIPVNEFAEFSQERVFPTLVSEAPTVEIAEVVPSSQIEVASTNMTGVEETVTTSTKAPKKRRHRRKHRKLRKIKKTTEAPTEVPTTVELQVESSTTLATTTTSDPPTTSVTTPVPTAPSTALTFPTVNAPGVKVGESYLGGWNEDEGVIVTTSGPSLGTAINQFSELPQSVPINDDQAIKEYYEKYYAEWYQKHNQATSTPEDSTSVPREIKIGLTKKSVATEPTTQAFAPSTVKPTREQLDKVCEYVAKISKSFGIKDLVGFAKNNCSFVQSFHPASTCEQIQHLMQYCVTGIFVEN